MFLIVASIQYSEDKFLDDMQRDAFKFFWEETNPATGQVKDRAVSDGVNDRHTVASIAATGYGLVALAVAAERGYVSYKDAESRVLTTLSFIKNNMTNVHGFYYHFVDMNTGERAWLSELSSIDTAIMICGVLTAKQYFASNKQIVELATHLYSNVDWPWMQNGQESLSMGWKPESGFIEARWNTYCELMMIYLLGVGSPAHPLSPQTWNAFTRPKITFQNFTYVDANAPLFTHQFSHAFFDFKGKRDYYSIDYFENSVVATQAHKAFCISIKDEFPSYSEKIWGITASDYAGGYIAWGGPPRQGPLDGTVVPCACGGSIPFAPECIKVLQNIKEQFPQSYSKYSFRDAFNPLTGWYGKDSLGIDLGITFIQAENYRTGFVWKWFGKNPEVAKAMKLVGFSGLEAGMQWWAWLLIVLAVLAVVAAAGFGVWKFMQKKKGQQKGDETEKMVDTGL